MRIARNLLKRSKKSLYLGVGLLAGVIIGGGALAIAQAAVPDTNMTIHACYTAGVNSSFRIVDGEDCAANETALDWQKNGAATGVLRQDLTGKDLSGSQMVYWDLRNINLTGTNLSGGNLSGADLRGSTLVGADLNSTLLNKADLRNQNLGGVNLSGTALGGALLSGVNFSNATITGANLNDQDLSGTNLANIPNFRNIEFYNGNLSGATLPSNVDFATSRLEHAQLKNLNLTGANFAGADLLGVDFSGSDLSNITWHDPSQGSTICPDGTNTSEDASYSCIDHL